MWAILLIPNTLYGVIILSIFAKSPENANYYAEGVSVGVFLAYIFGVSKAIFTIGYFLLYFLTYPLRRN